MSTIGSLVVSLGLDGAEFHHNIGKAKGGLKDFAGQTEIAKRKAENFAEEGLAKIIPVSGRVSDALIDMVGATQKGAAALQLFGQAFIIVAGATAVAQLVQAGQHWLTYGENVWKAQEAMEALKKSADEERATIEKRIGLQRGMMAELLKLQGDEMGALKLAEETRRQEIEKTFAVGAARNNALALNEKVFNEQRSKLREDSTAAIIASIEKERAAQVKAWQDETTSLMDQLTKRRDARANFVNQLGKGGMGGQTASGGFGSLRDLQAQFQKDLKDIGFLEREGLLSTSGANEAREERRRKFLESVALMRKEFSAFPVVVEAIQKSADAIDFSTGFGAEITKANDWVKDNISTLDDLKGRHEALHEFLTTKLPAGVDRAGQELKKLGDAWTELAWDIYAVNQQLVAFDKLGGE